MAIRRDVVEYQDWIAEWFANSSITELTPITAAAIIRKWRPGPDQPTPAWLADLAKVFDDMPPGCKLTAGEVTAVIEAFKG